MKVTMPAWIHNRADHLLKKNPGMDKSQAFAIATQQAYAAGKAPKKYGTKEGRQEAKAKYDDPKSSYVQTADPKQKTSSVDEAFWMGFTDELQKIAAATTVSDVTKTVKKIPTGMPKLTSKPVVGQQSAPQDFLGSSKKIPPPPVTAAGN